MYSTLRVEAVSSRCLHCEHTLLRDHRVYPVYRNGKLGGAIQIIELGLLGGGSGERDAMRPHWSHVDCQDPFLRTYAVRPDLSCCIRCKAPLRTGEMIHPCYCIDGVDAVNPHDPTDKGLLIGDRIHMAHVDCRDKHLTGSALLVGG